MCAYLYALMCTCTYMCIYICVKYASIHTTSIHIYLNVCPSTNRIHIHPCVCARTSTCACVCVCALCTCAQVLYFHVPVCLCERMHILRLAPVCVLVRLGAGVWLLGGGAQQGSAVLCASAASRDPVLTGTKSPGTAVYAPPTSLFSRCKRRTTLGDAGRQMQVRGNR